MVRPVRRMILEQAVRRPSQSAGQGSPGAEVRVTRAILAGGDRMWAAGDRGRVRSDTRTGAGTVTGDPRVDDLDAGRTRRLPIWRWHNGGLARSGSLDRRRQGEAGPWAHSGAVWLG